MLERNWSPGVGTTYFVVTDIITHNTRFHCDFRKCKGACCRGPYARSVGALRALDISRLKAALGKEYRTYINVTSSGHFLKVRDERCLFLSPGTFKCNVYPFRPGTCRTYPLHLERRPESFFQDHYHRKHFAHPKKRIREVKSLFRQEVSAHLPRGANYYFLFVCPDCPERTEPGQGRFLPKEELRALWLKDEIELLTQQPCLILTLSRVNKYLYRADYTLVKADPLQLGTVPEGTYRISSGDT